MPFKRHNIPTCQDLVHSWSLSACHLHFGLVNVFSVLSLTGSRSITCSVHALETAEIIITSSFAVVEHAIAWHFFKDLPSAVEDPRWLLVKTLQPTLDWSPCCFPGCCKDSHACGQSHHSKKMKLSTQTNWVISRDHCEWSQNRQCASTPPIAIRTGDRTAGAYILEHSVSGKHDGYLRLPQSSISGVQKLVLEPDMDL